MPKWVRKAESLGITRSDARRLAREWGISADKVLGWIRSGELRAINAAAKVNGRPRYLIDRDDIAAFEQRRQAVTPPPLNSRRRRRSADDVIEFF